jgi:4-carboxymuconolactone decarboxylase
MIQSRSPFEKMIQAAQDMAKAMNPSLGSFSTQEAEAMWPTMSKDWMEMMFGNALNKDVLNAKTKLLLTLAALTMRGAKNESVLRQCMRHFLETGEKFQETSEKIGLMSMFARIPAMTQAMELASEVMDPNEDKET